MFLITVRESPDMIDLLNSLYSKPNCLKELAKLHCLMLKIELIDGKILQNALAKEQVARSMLSLRTGEESMSAYGLGKDQILVQNLQKPTNLNIDNGIFGANDKRQKKESEIKRYFVIDSMKTWPANVNRQYQAAADNAAAAAPSVAAAAVREPITVAEWRQHFHRALTLRCARSERIRQLFCRKKYAQFIDIIRQINRLPVLRTCKQRRLHKKFDLYTEDGCTLLVERHSRRPYLCYEEIFDAIHQCHVDTGINDMRRLFTELRSQYANVTFECVLAYFKIKNPQSENRELAEKKMTEAVGQSFFTRF